MTTPYRRLSLSEHYCLPIKLPRREVFLSRCGACVIVLEDEAATICNAGANVERHFRHSVRSSQRELGASHPETLTREISLARILDARAKFDESELLYRRALLHFE